jgi:cytochrome c556
MRAALLIGLGLVIGILGTVFAMRALGERNPFPPALMVTMGYHRHQLQQALKARHCDTGANQDQLQRLQMSAADIPAAFPDAPQPFQELARQLHTAVQKAAQSAPTDCPALVAALKPVDQTCQQCHQQYR